MQEVAQRLKSLRESVGVSQAKLAALMGATQASVNRYENGQSSPPLKILRWYADFFDVSLDYIFAYNSLYFVYKFIRQLRLQHFRYPVNIFKASFFQINLFKYIGCSLTYRSYDTAGNNCI